MQRSNPKSGYRKTLNSRCTGPKFLKLQTSTKVLKIYTSVWKIFDGHFSRSAFFYSRNSDLTKIRSRPQIKISPIGKLWSRDVSKSSVLHIFKTFKNCKVLKIYIFHLKKMQIFKTSSLEIFKTFKNQQNWKVLKISNYKISIAKNYTFLWQLCFVLHQNSQKLLPVRFNCFVSSNNLPSTLLYTPKHFSTPQNTLCLHHWEPDSKGTRTIFEKTSFFHWGRVHVFGCQRRSNTTLWSATSWWRKRRKTPSSRRSSSPYGPPLRLRVQKRTPLSLDFLF